jgi:hypothetical protein
MDSPAPPPAEVAADEPVKKTRKKAEPKEPKAPRGKYDFGAVDASRVQKGFKIPSVDELKHAGKAAIRQAIVRSGKFEKGIANYASPRELALALNEQYPFDSKGYGIDGRKIANLEDLRKLAGDRRVAYTEVERVRTQEREALRRETFGELADKHRDNPTELMRITLGDKVWVPVRPQDGVRTVAEGERFYDVDGRTGRKQFYEFVAKDDLKVDGSPKAKATKIRISPQVFTEKILPDTEFAARFEVPEGFAAPEPKKPRGSSRKPAATQSMEDSLAVMGADNDHHSVAAEDLDEALATSNPAPASEAPASTEEVPEL